MVFNTHCLAQSAGDCRIYTYAEQMPEFRGGAAALQQYMAGATKYPADAVSAGMEGRVLVKFVVDTAGNITDAQVVKQVYPSLDTEALRVVSAMPAWAPGMQGGEKVNVSYTLPVKFALAAPASNVTDSVPLTSNTPATGQEKNDKLSRRAKASVNLGEFINSVMHYPEEARKNEYSGKVVIKFTVDKTGWLNILL